MPWKVIKAPWIFLWAEDLPAVLILFSALVGRCTYAQSGLAG